METFPSEIELLDFFQVEPSGADAKVPIAYTRLSFSAILGEERVECLIDNPLLEVRWFRHGVEQVFLCFCPVQRLSIQEYPGGKCLVAEGIGPKQQLRFRLQLRPRVHIALESSQ
jgi:hypothetical protein